jgi:hypothetical protein
LPVRRSFHVDYNGEYCCRLESKLKMQFAWTVSRNLSELSSQLSITPSTETPNFNEFPNSVLPSRLLLSAPPTTSETQPAPDQVQRSRDSRFSRKSTAPRRSFGAQTSNRPWDAKTMVVLKIQCHLAIKLKLRPSGSFIS